MVKLALHLRNIVYDKIVAAGSMTDVEMAKSLAKDDLVVPQDRLNKTLLDLEISGTITVSWFTKDTLKIELANVKTTEEEASDMKRRQREYEASFPGAVNE